ncbi:hypothetical protein HC752_21990 [Vibrio sp. S9_S30]|uniref:hypothetical protein n=1 Tax=Vibrio sp. S9_S30 TaxID=2720226 RepID=UPI0016800A7F|nr:hypothetical protein [Vibrio sp. S9_S30]MBD1559619.1 hypothetical protein [Vibrio sp. S9_S30]
MTDTIAPYLEEFHDSEASQLQNALARVKHLENLLGQSDIEKALIETNAELQAQLNQAQNKIGYQDKRYSAQCTITEQKQNTINRLTDQAAKHQQKTGKLESELQALGALLVKKR